MQPVLRTPKRVRFGVFEADLVAGELRKRGRRVALQDQPFQLLVLLLQRAGDVVTREELQKALWPANTFVEFDQGVNTAIKKIRQALGDSAENARFVETLPRKGYRFIAPVAAVEPQVAAPAPGQRSSRIIAGLGSVAILAVAAVWFLAGRTSTREAPVTPVPLTTYPGQELQPSFSPDGNYVTFVWNGEKQDNYDIYVKQIGTEKPLRLTTDAAKDFGPAWSPDGRSIAFGRLLAPLKAGIFVIPAIGGPERKLAETAAPHSRLADPFLAWSPDSKWLVISERLGSEQAALGPALGDASGPPASLFLLSVDAGERRRLTLAPTGSLFDAGPAFSPDGKAFAFIRATAYSVSDLYVLSLSSGLHLLGEPRRLTSWNRFTSSPAWTRDGREIVVASGKWDATGLWRVDVSGKRSPRRLEFAGNYADVPAISRSGHLAYAQRSVDVNIWRAELSGAGGNSVPPKRFIASTYTDMFPQFSPDGKRILYLSDRTGRTEVWVANEDGSNPMQLTSINAPIVGAPRWSPDGERIVFDSNLGGRWEVYVIRAAGGPARRMTNDPADDCCGNWSRDGRWIYFMSRRTGEQQIWKMPAGGGRAVQITRHGGHVAIESPDGRFVYYSVRGGEGERDGLSGLRRVPVDGGEEVAVLPSITFYNFAMVREGIYFIPRADPEGRYALHFLDFKTAKTWPIVTLSGVATPGLSVSPDGRSVLYSQIDERRSDLMLVENFR
jgi:Tol biopolymer transport system component/DNA-binding winged helix-turn-helix (wHTH) protein